MALKRHTFLFATLFVTCAVNANTDAKTENSYTHQDAIENLDFAASQYVKMVNKVNNKEDLLEDRNCKDVALCVPRAQDHDKIHMVQPRRWVVGFYPGALWMLLNNAEDLDSLQNKDNYKALFDHADKYSELLFEQAKRTDTHDLGFMVDAPLVYAIENKDVPAAKKKAYQEAIKTAERSLLTRYQNDQGVMKSWDFIPRIRASFVDKDGKRFNRHLDLASPWQYPVIVDNMMNMEILMKSEDPDARAKGFSHADATMKHHFFYEKTDTKQERPIAYHVFDYGEMKPGNWQGLGNRSAWARGQGWAIYGYVVSAIKASQDPDNAHKAKAYEDMVEKLYQSIDHFTKAHRVPIWDFFATRSDAYQIASYAGEETARFSRILELCIEELSPHILPYQGFGPIAFDKDILSAGTLEKFKGARSVGSGEVILQNGKVNQCGTQAYYLNGRVIPRDTSAAGIYASALYRMAGHIDDAGKAAKYERLADEIMLALVREFRTDIAKTKSYELGFVLNSATGHLPDPSEVDTPIVYGDYYFIEANLNKLKLKQ